MRPRATGLRRWGSPSRSRRRSSLAAGSRRLDLATGWRSGSRTTGSSPGRASMRPPRSEWSSTSARRRSIATPSSSPLRHGSVEGGPFSERYVFPDGETLHVSRVILALERAGFIARHVEEFGADYAETLRHWIANLDRNLERAEQLAGPERLRVWRLYLRAARNGFEIDFTSVYQVLCRFGGG